VNALAGGFLFPTDVAVDGIGNVFVADTDNLAVKEIVAAGGYATVNTLATGLSDMSGVGVAGNGDIFVTLAEANVLQLQRSQPPPVLTFATTPVGATSSDSPRSVVLENIGTAPLTGSESINLAASSDFYLVYVAGTPPECNLGYMLAPGESCNLSVSFIPFLPGLRPGTIVLIDNSLNANFAMQTIQLSGTGTGKATETIMFNPIISETYGAGPVTLSAASSSGLAVTFASMTPTVCTVAGTTAILIRAGTCNIDATQAGNADYSAAPPVTQSFTVSKAVLTVTANNASRVYGAANPFLSYRLSGFVNNDPPSVVLGTANVTTTATSASRTGIYPISFSAEPLIAANYSFTYVDGTLTVTKGLLTIIANNFSRPYGAANPFLSYRVSGFVNGDPPTVVLGTAKTTTAATATSPVGTYAISFLPAPLLAANYNFQYVDGTLTVAKAAQTIGFGPLANQIYGAAPFALDATASSGLPVSYAVTGPATLSGAMLTITGAGTVKVTASQAGNADYAAATPGTQSFTVAKAVLTVTANNASRPFGAANPFLGYSIAGFVNNDPPSVVLGTAKTTTTATAASPAGMYPIGFLPAPLLAANYTFSYVDGTLTVTGEP